MMQCFANWMDRFDWMKKLESAHTTTTTKCDCKKMQNKIWILRHLHTKISTYFLLLLLIIKAKLEIYNTKKCRQFVLTMEFCGEIGACAIYISFFILFLFCFSPLLTIYTDDQYMILKKKTAKIDNNKTTCQLRLKLPYINLRSNEYIQWQNRVFNI